MHVLILLLACASGIVARANGEVITEQQVVERLGRAQQMGLRATPRNIVDDLVTEALVAQDGYAKGMQRDPAVTAAVEQARRKLAAARFVAKEIDSAAKATDEQLLAMYHATADSANVEAITLVSEGVAKATLGRLLKGASFADECKFAVESGTSQWQWQSGHAQPRRPWRQAGQGRVRGSARHLGRAGPAAARLGGGARPQSARSAASRAFRPRRKACAASSRSSCATSTSRISCPSCARKRT